MALEKFTTTSASLTLTTGELLELQPGTNQVLTHLDGWFSPAGTRREGTARLWAHGSFSERGWRDERIITLGGHIFTASRTDAANMTDTLAAALADGTAGKFIVDDADLGYREAEVYITGTPTVNWDGNLDIFFMIDMVAPDPRKYGELVTANAPAAAPGGGLVMPLFSGLGNRLRVNYAAQPSVEVASTNWTSYGSSVTGAVMTNGGKYGQNYYRLTYSAAVSGNRGRYHDEPVAVGAGETWTASMWVRPSAALTLHMRMEFRTASPDALVGSSIIGADTACPANVWTRLSVTGTASGPADRIRVQNYAFGTTFPAGATYDLDAEQIELGTLTDFFDGSSTASGKAYQWTGATGNSASEEYASVDGFLDFGPAGADGTVTFDNAGTADAAPVFTVSGYAPGFTITEVSTGARLIYTGTVLDGQTLTINAADGSVLLDGYADRSALLTRREWTRVPGRTRSTYLFESPDSAGASLTLGVKPAWW